MLYGPRVKVPTVATLRKEIEKAIADKLARLSGPKETVWATVLEQVQAELSATYPNLGTVRFDSIPVCDTRRLVRRLEIIHLTGADAPSGPHIPPLAECANLKYDFRCVFLQAPRIWNARRIDYRVEKMVAGGLIEEVAGLMQAGLTPNMQAATAIGYRQTMAYLEQMDFSDDAFRAYLEDVQASTRQYSRRQRMWFREEDIYENVDVPVPELPILATPTPGALELPRLVFAQLERHLARLYVLEFVSVRSCWTLFLGFYP